MPKHRDSKWTRVVVGGQVLFLVLLAAMATFALMSSSTTLDPTLEERPTEPSGADRPVERPRAEPPVTRRPTVEAPDVEPAPGKSPAVPPPPTAKRRGERKIVVNVVHGAPMEVEGTVYPLVFPIAEDGALLTASFGDPRSGERSHAGEDIMAPKMTPVVAAADGVVIWLHDAKEGRRSCCALTLLHPDGWRTRYIHLNNDTPGTDDGLAYGIVAGLEVGSEVKAGELIGWVGDSGNAEHTGPHLHFELRDPDGKPVDPYPSLLATVMVAE